MVLKVAKYIYIFHGYLPILGNTYLHRDTVFAFECNAVWGRL